MTPRRTPRPCPSPGCPELIDPGSTLCPRGHGRKPWSTSSRTSKLSGSAQAKRARRILRRDHGICYLCGHPGANIADHVIPLAEGGADDENNLRAAHASPCHEAKTEAEKRRGIARRRSAGG